MKSVNTIWWFTANLLRATRHLPEAAITCGLLCSSKQVAQGQSQAVPDVGLHKSLPRGPITNTHSGGLHTTLEQDPVSSTAAHSGRSRQTPGPAGVYSALWGQPPAQQLIYIINPHINQPESQPHPQMGQQSKLNCNRRTHMAHIKGIYRAPSSFDQGDCNTELPKTLTA